MKTWLTERKNSQDFKCPILLPGNHVVVQMLNYDRYAESCHVVVQAMMSLLRQECWLTRARQSVRTIVTKCVICRRYGAKPLVTAPAS